MTINYRRCISCRKLAPKQDFWRIVRVYSSQAVQLDWGMGRSAYLCPQSSCLQLARKKNRLGRALKAIVPDSIYHALEKRLTCSEDLAIDQYIDQHTDQYTDQYTDQQR